MIYNSDAHKKPYTLRLLRNSLMFFSTYCRYQFATLIHSVVGFTAGLVMCDVEEHWSHTSNIIV